MQMRKAVSFHSNISVPKENQLTVRQTKKGGKKWGRGNEPGKRDTHARYREKEMDEKRPSLANNLVSVADEQKKLEGQMKENKFSNLGERR